MSVKMRIKSGDIEVEVTDEALGRESEKSSVTAPVNMFIKMGDIEGEATDYAHHGEIEVLAWNWGMSQSGTTHVGGGGGAGKVSFKDLSLTKYVDKATPKLMLHCCNGKHIPECTLVVCKAGEKPVEYITIAMTDCLVASVSNDSSRGEERLTETITLNFAEVNVSYQPIGQDGRPSGGAIDMGWDIEKNIET